MAYTDDAVKAKLSALNETQEGIVTVAQWVMFHRRHAERTAQLWLQKLRDSPSPKRLNLIYLANEVAQQSKARRKEDFLIAFAPVCHMLRKKVARTDEPKIIAEATAVAYKGASNDIQQKLRRVVEVWRQRSIFELPIQEAIEARVDELDKSRSTGKKSLLGGSIFSNSSGSVPSELQPLVPLQVAVTKASMTATTAGSTANAEFDKMNDPNTPLPTPPVHAARLSQLLKTLANAENSVSESIKSRQALIDGLEKILETNRTALAKEQTLVTQLSERKADTEAKKREVEDNIMRGLSAENSPAEHIIAAEGEPVPRPEVEALTPPPVEALTPVGSPKQEQEPQPQEEFSVGALTSPALQEPRALSVSGEENSTLPAPGWSLSGSAESLPETNLPGLPGIQSSLPLGNTSTNGVGAKKRKVSHGEAEEDYAEFAGGDLDADVAELLEQEGHAQR